MISYIRICFLVGLALIPQALFAQLKLAGVFADHMVIQRDRPITIWGTAEPGTEISLTLAEGKSSAKAQADGTWKATFDPMKTSGPFELKASSGADSRTIKDIMIGDLWLISGQSNMVLALQSTTEWPEVKTAGTFPGIRICKLPGNYSFDPTDNFSRAISWDLLDSARAGAFSGVGYHFARTLQPEIGVTLGLIQGSAGGTQVEQWTPEADLKAEHPDSLHFAARDKAMAAVAADPSAKANSITAGAATLYNGTIHPIRFLKLAGVLWYQGEANSRTKADYRKLLGTFVRSWRKVFDEPELPFVIVQLPKFGLPKDDSWNRAQEAQMLAARDLGLALVVTVDQGSKETIHPPNKQEVGRRAGLAALQHVYRKSVLGTSPVPSSVQFQGADAIVEFPESGDKIAVRGEGIPGFELAGADRKFQPATARLDGQRLIVQAEGVTSPVAVRYLWTPSPDIISLFTASGLPVAPFRSDFWPAADHSPLFEKR